MEILYIMHVNWGWIKQRPQFIAELLARKNNVTVVYRHRYRNKNLKNAKSDNTNLNFSEIYTMPGKLDKISVFKEINNLIYKSKIKKLIREKKPSAIYITYPSFIKYIPQDYKGKIIYDCMDNYYLMAPLQDRQEIYKNEKILLKMASTVLFSSRYLFESIKKRYHIDELKNAKIERNGFIGPIRKLQATKNKKELAYFGTISSWFDFSMLLRSLNDFPDITYKIIGPLDPNLKNIPNNDRIKFIGVVNHEKLYNEIKNCCGLIMPFKLNEFIKAVDPVKLYEYINFNKNIICVRYDEVMRFNKFVYFYNSYDEYKNAIKMIISDKNGTKYSSDEREKFLSDNTWEHRVKDINNILEAKG